MVDATQKGTMAAAVRRTLKRLGLDTSAKRVREASGLGTRVADAQISNIRTKLREEEAAKALGGDPYEAEDLLAVALIAKRIGHSNLRKLVADIGQSKKK